MAVVASDDLGDVTEILRRAAGGDLGSREDLIAVLMTELRRRASWLMRGQPASHTLQTTALVNEVYMRVLGSATVNFENRRHFLGAMSRAMRNVLIDHARRKTRLKRTPPGERSSLDAVAIEGRPIDWISLDEAIESLREVNADAAELVNLRYFLGLSMHESAETLSVSVRSAERLWTFARAWLRDRVR